MLRKRFRADDDDDDDASVMVIDNNIYYRGEIKEPTATEFCKVLRDITNKQKDMKDGCVRIFISSGGGDAFAGLTMFEHIKSSKKYIDVITIADGYVASAATFPILAGTRRLMGETSTMLIHQVSSGQFGYFKAKEMENEARNTATLMNIVYSLYEKHSSVCGKRLNKILDEEKLLTFKECKSLGLVDGTFDDVEIY